MALQDRAPLITGSARYEEERSIPAPSWYGKYRCSSYYLFLLRQGDGRFDDDRWRQEHAEEGGGGKGWHMNRQRLDIWTRRNDGANEARFRREFTE